MRDGLYKVDFRTQGGSGAGVVVLQGGKVRGGDSGLYYAGTFAENGDQITAQIATNRHTVGIGSVFGRDRVNISLRGTAKGDTAQMTGTAAEAPGLNFQASLTRIAD
jgi:hypothetical protein